MRARAYLRRLAAVTVILALGYAAHAGGPLYVAGTSEFAPGTAGTPLTWPGGALVYFTDRGVLSPALDGPAADRLVADAFARWTEIPTAAVSASHGGQLDEDVDGTNVTRMNGVLTLPADIQDTAFSKPVAVVYDADGQVTDAFLGAGASSPALCATNAAFGGPDNLSAAAHYQHALVVMNGLCAPTASDVPEMRYRLARTLGRVFGLGWSQLNDDVVTAPPAPAADLAGFPLMHAADPPCDPVSSCIPSADVPRMDDRAALSRLYPVTAANLADFPGKSVFSANTARVSGTVTFPGGPGMEGVNVVARRLDPASGAPSGEFAASSVSGFLFRGDAGNRVTGYLDPDGHRCDRFGSADPALQGFFDLSGLEIADGAATADYQITLEPINPAYVGSVSVGPYAGPQVAPYGHAGSFTVHLARGTEAQEAIAVTQDAPDWHEPAAAGSFSTPGTMPADGDWLGLFNRYGEADYFRLDVRSDRTLTFDVVALDEWGAPNARKLRPAVGLWLLADGNTVPPRDSAVIGDGATLSRLQHSFAAGASFKIGIEDLRGDGRPDFLYQARILYGDRVQPARASTAGGTATIYGMGFLPGLQVRVGGLPATVYGISRRQMMIEVPRFPTARTTSTSPTLAPGRAPNCTRGWRRAPSPAIPSRSRAMCLPYRSGPRPGCCARASPRPTAHRSRARPCS